uniref:Uncharacterized protein n=1 Tax=Phlebotomus papatasi TaxID=29031 RepID=A0A1B0DLZ8_PHLPP
MASSKADLTKCTDSMEKVIHSMQLTKDMCFDTWSQSPDLRHHLTRLLASSKLGDELSAAIYATGSLIRKFPLAQKESLTKRGISVLLDIWTKHVDLKVKIKVLTLIADLVRESHDVALQQNEPSEKDEEKFRQKVPPGLHYRINLETGEKEAKILEETDESENQKSSLTIVEEEVAKENASDSPTLEDALKNIPGDSFQYTPEQIKDIKSKFRTYEDIKHELKDELNMDVKTDAEIVTSFIKKYEGLKKGTVNPEVIKILEELEYLVHQIDNANNFVDQNGIEKIIIPNIVNQTNSIIRTKEFKKIKIKFVLHYFSIGTVP